MLLSLLIAIIIVGMLVYLVDLVPMDPKFQQIAKVLLIGTFIIWLLRLLWPLLPDSLR